MNGAKIIMILTLFLTMTVIIGQPPANCRCYLATDPTRDCNTTGCSNGSSHCTTRVVTYGNLPTLDNPTDHLYFYYYADGGVFTYDTYTGCSCPGYPYNRTTSNFYNDYYGFYDELYDIGCCSYNNHSAYNYDTCTDFGGNVRDRSGNVPAGANDATNCCNYCCNRNDPHTHSGGHEIILNKLLYLSGLNMLVLITLKIN